MGLPKMIVLKSNNNTKYLIYKIENDQKVAGLLQFSGDTVWSSFAKFKVERSKNGGGLVHVRSSYNNKYWVKSAPKSWLITASADEPQEDQTKPTCTLFKPCSGAEMLDSDDEDDEYDDEAVPSGTVSKSAMEDPTFRLQHVQSGNYVCLSKKDGACLYLGSSSPGRNTNNFDFTVIDWDSLVILPKHVTFKSTVTGNYLGPSKSTANMYFNIEDFGANEVRHEVFANNDGGIYLKSASAGKFWARSYSTNSILASKTEQEAATDKDCLFWPIKLENNVFALRNLGSDAFCGSRDTRFATDRNTMSKEMRLVVEEAVLSRSVYNVNFRLSDARIYDQRILTMATGDAVNMTDEPVNVDLVLSYTATKSSSWDTSFSLKIGVRCSYELGVPRLLDGKIEIYSEYKGEYQFGEVLTTTNLVETAYSVTVPGKTRMSVSLMATQCSCDVPFSYDQEDILTDGRRVTHTLDGGFYTGIDCYDFEYETVEEKLPL